MFGQACVYSSILAVAVSIECYTGLRVLAGQSIGTETIKCDNSGAYCYNMTANAAVLVDVMKAGCSLWRCMLAQNKCISTKFQNIPISLCCCSGDRCNVGDGGSGGSGLGALFGKQTVGGWNAEPSSSNHSSATAGESEHKWDRDEVARRFGSMEVDEDSMSPSTTRRADRHHQEREGGVVEIP